MIDVADDDGRDGPADSTGSAPAAAPSRPAEAGEWYVSSGPPHEIRWLAEDFPSNFAAGASSPLGTDLHVRLSAAAESSREHFTQTVEDPTCCYVLSASEASADAAEDPGGAVTIWLEFSPPIAFAMLECLLGGSAGQAPPPDRALTVIERRVLHRVATLAAVSLAGAWPGSPRPRLQVGLQSRPHTDADADAEADADTTEPAVVITFELTLAHRAGTMRLCADRRIIEGAIPSAAARRAGVADLELSAALEGIFIDEEELATLAAGDIVATDIAADGEVIVRIGGIPKFAARLGTSGRCKAITITRRLDEPGAE